MANPHVRILDPTIMCVVNHNDLIGHFGHAPAFGPDQRYGAQAVFPGPVQAGDVGVS